jgi:acyl dehydratase
MADTDFYFEDFPPGKVFVTPEWEATPERIIDFASKYDAQYFHLDPVKARASYFGGLVCSGFQTAALAWGLAVQTRMFEQCAVAGIGVDEMRWFLPVREGDRVRVEFGLIEGKPSRSKPDIASVVFAYTVLNQRDETVMTMKLLQLLRRRPGSPPPA